MSYNPEYPYASGLPNEIVGHGPEEPYTIETASFGVRTQISDALSKDDGDNDGDSYRGAHHD